MLEPILQSLRDVEGVQGAMIVDATGGVVAHRAHTIYDLSVLQQVARAVVHTIDSVQLIHDDWDVLTAHFGEGKVLLRNLRLGNGKPRSYALAVIADATLNVAFLGVALRVAAGKLATELEAGPPATSSVAAPLGATLAQPMPAPAAMSATQMPSTQMSPMASTVGRAPAAPAAEPPRAELARTGLSWSGVASSATGSSGSSVGGYSDVGVSDTESSTFLTACTKALGKSVGPMAKVFVMEGVRKVCGDRAFSRTDGPALLAHLAAGIEDSDDRASFQRATRSL
jgi:predicted regulator of Ras-like GTPase activity (Roadblock/LC7/MglB family)